MIIVADASPLVALAICNCLNVLEILFGEVRVSQIVFDEVTFERRPGAGKLAIYLQDKIINVNLDSYIIGGETLDEGE